MTIPAWFTSAPRRVITLGYVDGYKIRDILAPGVDQSLKDWVMLKLYEITWQQLLSFGVVHVDPHPSNCLVTPTRSSGFSTSGASTMLPPDLRAAYRDLNRALLEDDDELLRDSLVRLDFLNPEDDYVDARHLAATVAPVLVDRKVDPRDYKSMDELSAAVQRGLQAGIGRRLLTASFSTA